MLLANSRAYHSEREDQGFDSRLRPFSKALPRPHHIPCGGEVCRRRRSEGGYPEQINRDRLFLEAADRLGRTRACCDRVRKRESHAAFQDPGFHRWHHDNTRRERAGAAPRPPAGHCRSHRHCNRSNRTGSSNLNTSASLVERA